jgi:Zn-dependent peptidase ImmA (M78 family)/transcriptional regulator with XRE-family HTH domain
MPVNSEVLRWARETSGLDVNDVARKIKRKTVTSQTIKFWENGKSSPTYPQLEYLAYKVYKRPLALFFFPEPPKEETPKQSFRTLPDSEISLLEPRLHYLIRQARIMQINLSELNEGVNPAKQQIVKDLTFKPNVSVAKMTKVVREYLNVSLKSQQSWSNFYEAFRGWRNILEENGIFIFKESFNQRLGRGVIESEFSGFCLYSKIFPVIYINNSHSLTRQIFTIFHELAHLLLGTGGVDTRFDDYIEDLKGDKRKIEILCNKFAGSFLVPEDDFKQQTKGVSINNLPINKLAKRYYVSREVILRKLFDRGFVSNSFYEEKVEEWSKIKKSKRKNGGDYYKTKAAYLGENYIDLAFSRYLQNRISLDQLSDYLGVKVDNLGKMELQLFRREGNK